MWKTTSFNFRAGQLDVGDRFAVRGRRRARRSDRSRRPVRDDHDARAAGGKPAQVLEEAFDSVWCKRCGHFVEQG